MTISEINKEKLRNLGVGIIYLFGSRALGTALEKSDYDIGLVFIDPKKAFKNKELFTDIYQILNNDFPDRIDGPRLDISFLQQANPALEMSAIRDSIVLFEINPVFRADYEEGALKRYDDYSSLKREYEEATLRAFGK